MVTSHEQHSSLVWYIEEIQADRMQLHIGKRNQLTKKFKKSPNFQKKKEKKAKLQVILSSLETAQLRHSSFCREVWDRLVLQIFHFFSRSPVLFLAQKMTTLTVRFLLLSYWNITTVMVKKKTVIAISLISGLSLEASY